MVRNLIRGYQGLCARHLGLIRSNSINPIGTYFTLSTFVWVAQYFIVFIFAARRWLLAEMVARTLKNVMRKKMRDVYQSTSSFSYLSIPHP